MTWREALLVTSQDSVSLKTRGFTMRVDVVAGYNLHNICQSLP